MATSRHIAAKFCKRGSREGSVPGSKHESSASESKEVLLNLN